jgi:ketosteroid isomerase-like protein
MSEENVELTNRAYEAFNRRDLDAFLALVDPEVEFTTRYLEMEADRSYRGHEGVREWWRTLLGIFPDFMLEVLEVRDLGDTVIAPLRIHGHGLESGVPFEEMLWQVGEWHEGKVTWWRNCGSEAEALAAAGLSE